MQQLVSIIITNYNYAEFVAEAIDSALQQSGVEVEVIVVNDGSTDASADIIAGYGDAIRSFYQPNGGQCAASNTGFLHSRGDVIVFLDADDYLLPGAAQSLAAALAGDAQASKSQGYLNIIDRRGKLNGKRIPRRLSPSGSYGENTLHSGTQAFRHAFTSGCAWPRSFLRQVMPLPELRILGTDSCLNMVSTLFGRTLSLDQAVAAYRVHGENIGPASLTFSAESIQQRLAQWEATHQYFAEWARKRGHAVSSDAAWRRARDWRVSLLAYSLALLQGETPAASAGEFLMSPLRTSQTHRVRALFLTGMYCVVRCLPRRPALMVARWLLQLPKPGVDGMELPAKRTIV